MLKHVGSLVCEKFLPVSRGGKSETLVTDRGATVENLWLERTVPTWSMGQAAQGWGSKPVAERVLVEVVLARKMFWTRVRGKRLVEEVERALKSSARVRSPGPAQD
jgi:hypothetical protein